MPIWMWNWASSKLSGTFVELIAILLSNWVSSNLLTLFVNWVSQELNELIESQFKCETEVGVEDRVGYFKSRKLSEYQIYK